MYPEVKKLLQTRRTVALVEDRLALFFSIHQINSQFHQQIKQANEESQSYRTIKKGVYYVIFGPGVDETELILGKEFLGFGVSLPSLKRLKKLVHIKNPLVIDHIGFAAKLEELFLQKLSEARAEMSRYFYNLDSLHLSRSATSETIHSLFEKELEKKVERQQKFSRVMASGTVTEGENRSHRFMMKEIDKKLQHLSNLLLSRGSM